MEINCSKKLWPFLFKSKGKNRQKADEAERNPAKPEDRSGKAKEKSLTS
jgi:hypothetical protein